MKTWERIRVPTRCGRCARPLEVGDPVLVFLVGAARSRKLRCAACEGPAPPELPPVVVLNNAITPTPLVRMRPLLPLGTPLADYRARASGEREPGEDG